MLQLTISLPVITVIFNDCTSTLSLMYMQKDARHSFARDFFFVCAAVFCVYTVMKTFTKTIMICTQDLSDKPDVSDKPTITIYHMPAAGQRASDDATANPTAATSTTNAETSTTNAATSTTDPTPTSENSMDYKAPSSPFAAKTPQTPSPANESMGPEEVEDEKN